MRALLIALCATAALTTACNGSSPGASPTPSATGRPDAFTALAPPRSPGVGDFPVITSQRAYEAARGLLALSLAEPGTLNGSATASLLEGLAVPDPAFSVAPYLRTPTRRGLDIRPLFARTVTLADDFVEVVRSSYSADAVQGAGGEQGIRVTWDGAVRYRVTVAGVAREVAYVLHVAYVFESLPNEPGGLRLVQVLPGTSHAAPVVASCYAKGSILPAAGSPTSSDFAPGPWLPAPAGPACPV
ncbi:MAG TPA: hypothetical protein VM097_06825 [Mycobacteriales bacterium]|nr:hypothetical protein [Mycobacteriales bacterium]